MNTGRAYGNAIVATQAQAFVESVVECIHQEQELGKQASASNDDLIVIAA